MPNTPQTPPYASESGYRVFVLASNYRCRAAIAEAAQRLILHNDGRFPKETNPIHPGGSISVTRCETPAAELALVLNKVTELMQRTGKDVLSRPARTGLPRRQKNQGAPAGRIGPDVLGLDASGKIQAC